MRVYLFLLLSFFSIHQLYAQHFIKGRIITASERTGLEGAAITCGTKGTVSSVDGTFEISLERGKHTITTSFLGYESQLTAIDVPYSGILLIQLKEQSRMLNTTVVYAQKDYPMTVTHIDQKTLNKQNFGQDLPILLNFQPSVVTTSDGGNGVGYTGMRIRGTDPARINVTVNGIPVNDPESHGVFWVNMSDFASSTQQVSIQRGAGSSVNGAAAFGASVNINTIPASDKAFAEVGSSYGSFNTWRTNASFSTGKIKDKLSIYGRLSRTHTDGYIDNAWGDLRSFFLSGRYETKAGTFTANVFSNDEQTFQAWDGVSAENIANGNRRFNQLARYDNEIDQYKQSHYHLLYHLQKGQWTWNAGLHYTRGKGFFEQFKEDAKLSSYNMPNIVLGDTVIKRTDLIRRKWLDNHFVGGIFSAQYVSKSVLADAPVLDVVIGGGANQYWGRHYGEVIWAKYMGDSKIRHRYYDNDAKKLDANIYVKANYQLAEGLFLFGDLQYRHIYYQFVGPNISGITGETVDTNQADKLYFFNPKAGVNYRWDRHHLYGSFAVAQKEPTRDEYTESSQGSRPRPEKLYNWEAGYRYQGGIFSAEANAYWMRYIDQLVVTGQINDVGAYTRTNIPDSYRAGIELQAALRLHRNLEWHINSTFSRNKVSDFKEYLDDYDAGGQKLITYKNTDIALSPNIVAASQLIYKLRGWEFALLSKYVGKQYLDNTQNAQRSIAAYHTQDVRISYGLSNKYFDQFSISLLVNNITNTMYSSNGYTYGYIAEDQEIRERFYYPQAGTNYMLALRMRI